MLSFKKHIQEVAEPKAGDEKRFKDKHVVAVTDYPGNDDDSKVQNMTKKSPAKKKRLADMDQAEAEKVYEEKMMKCEDCGEEYDADEGEHECDMEEHFERIAGELLDEGINVDDLTEEQLDEILGRIVRGAGRLAKRAVVNKQGNVRFSTAGRADSAERTAARLEKKKQDRERLKKAQDRVAKARAELNNSYVPEEKMSDSQMKKREEIVKGMKDKEADLKKRYGDRWKSVMYATATKKAMEEEVKLDEISKELAQKVFKARANQAYKHDDDERRNKEIASKSAEAGQKRSRREMGTNAKKRDRLDQLDKRAKDAKIRADNASYRSSQAYKKVAKSADYIEKRHGEKSIPTTASDKHYEYKAKGGKLPFDKWKAQYGERKEEFQIDEAFKVGAMKLKDGSSVKLAKEDVQALDNLYKNLNSSNRKKMQEKLEANKKSFGEILAFAKQAM